MVLYILGYLFLVYVTLFRLIVLYSRCRVNWGTNLSVVLYDVIIFLLLPLRVWASVFGVPNLWGVPHYAAVHSIIATPSGGGTAYTIRVENTCVVM